MKAITLFFSLNKTRRFIKLSCILSMLLVSGCTISAKKRIAPLKENPGPVTVRLMNNARVYCNTLFKTAGYSQPLKKEIMIKCMSNRLEGRPVLQKPTPHNQE